MILCRAYDMYGVSEAIYLNKHRFACDTFIYDTNHIAVILIQCLLVQAMPQIKSKHLPYS